jgi:hypothetical protein
MKCTALFKCPNYFALIFKCPKLLCAFWALSAAKGGVSRQSRFLKSARRLDYFFEN